MAIWTVSMPQKSSWEKLRGTRFCERIGTLGGAGQLVIGVTTLGSNGALVCLVCELLFDILSVTAGAWEKLRLDWIIQRGMCAQRPWQVQLEVREFEPFGI
jgi:hypothetical protein